MLIQILKMQNLLLGLILALSLTLTPVTAHALPNYPVNQSPNLSHKPSKGNDNSNNKKETVSKVDPAIKCDKKNCDLIQKYVNPTMNLLTVAFGLLAVISLIFGSINYTTSEGDPQKASAAKRRIFNVVIAVVAYLFLYSFLQFLIPGGVFNR